MRSRWRFPFVPTPTTPTPIPAVSASATPARYLLRSCCRLKSSAHVPPSRSQEFRNLLLQLPPRPRRHDGQFSKPAPTIGITVPGQSDERLAQMIRDDKIDILVDLGLHMAGGRLLLFASKPAPVQVTFAGYPGTTGVAAIDYRITDPSGSIPPESSTQIIPNNPFAFQTASGATRSPVPAAAAQSSPRANERLYHLRLPQQFLQNQRERPGPLVPGLAESEKLPSDPPGPDRPAPPAHPRPHGAVPYQLPDRRSNSWISLPLSQYLQNLSPHRPLPRTRSPTTAILTQLGFLLDGCPGGHADRKKHYRRPGRLEPALQSGFERTRRRNSRKDLSISRANWRATFPDSRNSATYPPPALARLPDYERRPFHAWRRSRLSDHVAAMVRVSKIANQGRGHIKTPESQPEPSHSISNHGRTQKPPMMIPVWGC